MSPGSRAGPARLVAGLSGGSRAHAAGAEPALSQLRAARCAAARIAEPHGDREQPGPGRRGSVTPSRARSTSRDAQAVRAPRRGEGGRPRAPASSRVALTRLPITGLGGAAGPGDRSRPSPPAVAADPDPTALAPPAARRPPPTGRARPAAGRAARRPAPLRRLERRPSGRLGRAPELTNRAVADDTAARQRADAGPPRRRRDRPRADAAAAAAERARPTPTPGSPPGSSRPTCSAPLGLPGPRPGRRRRARAAAATSCRRPERRPRRRCAAQIEEANADSRARAARAEADAAAARAAEARAAADGARPRPRATPGRSSASKRDLRAERDAADAACGSLEASTPPGRADASRAEAFAAAARGHRRDAACATPRRPAHRPRSGAPRRADPDATEDTTPSPRRASTPRGCSDEVKLVLDRALSQLGVVYAWGGGDEDGPTLGIRDGGVADSYGDFDKVGFDCSGLMIYAFAGIGKGSPHYSGYQSDAGHAGAARRPQARRHAVLGRRRGQPHHVALYLGDDQMVEAPESGKVVRIAPVRFDDGSSRGRPGWSEVAPRRSHAHTGHASTLDSRLLACRCGAHVRWSTLGQRATEARSGVCGVGDGRR